MKTKKRQKASLKMSKIVKIVCKKCKSSFGIEEDFIGIINCPYCQEYVEG